MLSFNFKIMRQCSQINRVSLFQMHFALNDIISCMLVARNNYGIDMKLLIMAGFISSWNDARAPSRSSVIAAAITVDLVTRGEAGVAVAPCCAIGDLGWSCISCRPNDCEP